MQLSIPNIHFWESSPLFLFCRINLYPSSDVPSAALSLIGWPIARQPWVIARLRIIPVFVISHTLAAGHSVNGAFWLPLLSSLLEKLCFLMETEAWRTILGSALFCRKWFSEFTVSNWSGICWLVPLRLTGNPSQISQLSHPGRRTALGSRKFLYATIMPPLANAVTRSKVKPKTGCSGDLYALP